MDSIKEKLGDGALYMAFSSNNKNICVSSDDLKEEIYLDETLKYFTSQSIDKYYMNDQFFKFP